MPHGRYIIENSRLLWPKNSKPALGDRVVPFSSTRTPSAAVVGFLASLPPGSIIAQLDDGSIAVCKDLDEADQRINESRKASGNATLLDRKDTSSKYVEATA